MLLGHVYFVGFHNNDHRARYFALASYIAVISMGYPVCWGLSEGSNTISPTSEMVFYGILDLFSILVFLLVYVIFLVKLDTQASAPQPPAASGTAEGDIELGQREQGAPVPPAAQKAPEPSAQNRDPGHIGESSHHGKA